MNTENQGELEKWTMIDKLAIFGVGTTLLDFFFHFIPDDSQFWPKALLFGIFIVCSGFLFFRKVLKNGLNVFHVLLVNLSPWLIATVLVLSCLIFYRVAPQATSQKLLFNNGRGSVFRSFDDNHAYHTKRLQAWGAKKGDDQWVISEAGQTAHFSYEVDPSQPPSIGASSGAYLTFYESPLDRLQYHSIVFDCRATDYQGTPDVGVRLAVDNPNLAGDRELAAYEFDSVISINLIDKKWRTYDLPIEDFQQTRTQPPFPNGLDANTINKIVFFVDNKIGSNSPAATICIRDIRFIK